MRVGNIQVKPYKDYSLENYSCSCGLAHVTEVSVRLPELQESFVCMNQEVWLSAFIRRASVTLLHNHSFSWGVTEKIPCFTGGMGEVQEKGKQCMPEVLLGTAAAFLEMTNSWAEEEVKGSCWTLFSWEDINLWEQFRSVAFNGTLVY